MLRYNGFKSLSGNKIIDHLEKHRVLIIEGEPGCGKSTRVPQYALEAWAKKDNGFPGRIIVTQPRRIAAISLSERVAFERGETVGETVGFQVRLNSNFNPSTGRIMYCTTGILLRRLQHDPLISDCSHVILDEAHERDVNTDLLMNLVRDTLKANPNIKVIIMSATLEAKLFQEYFENAPILNIPGFTYPVKHHFLTESKNLSKTYNMCAGKMPTVIHEDVVQMICHIHKSRPEGAILCFLPGWDEIMKVYKLIPQCGSLSVMCLHSKLDINEQRKIFSRPPPGVRKIILATNIAETSITIDDVVYVIDTGIHKEQRFDPEKGVNCIDNYWISQASAKQRRGRAGRCQPGESFHLYPETKYNEFQPHSVPEILRTSLTKIVLDSKVYSNNMVAVEFLDKLISSPDKMAIEKAVEELKELELLDEEENLTALGKTLSEFQLEPKLSKAMVNSVIFKCVTPIIDIATLFSSDSSLFSKTLGGQAEIKDVKSEYSKNSDHLSLMRMYEMWLDYIERGNFHAASMFCHQKGLVEPKLKIIQKLTEIHADYLYKGLKDTLPLADDFSDNDELVKAILLSGVGNVLQHRSWDIVKGKMKKSNVLATKHNQKATITSESVNSRKGKFSSNFLFYINETLSNLRHTTIVRESSVISNLSVLLFKNGQLKIEEIENKDCSKNIPSEDVVLLRIEGSTIAFYCDRKIAETIKRCKAVLHDCMQYYIYQLTRGEDHNEQVNFYWNEILRKLNDILIAQKLNDDLD